MRRFLTIGVMISVVLATSVPLFLSRGEGESVQGNPAANTYDEEDLMARYTRDRMFYQASERGEINIVDRSKYFEILKKVLTEYPQSSFAPAWQLAIATQTNKLEDFQKVVHQYPGNDFIHAIAYTKMGEIYRSKGKDTEAEASFQKALLLIDRCIINEPQNAAYSYYKAVIKIKQTGETVDWDPEKAHPEGRLMQPDIFSEVRRGTKKDYFSLPFLDAHSIIDLYKSTRQIIRRLAAQRVYYENRGDIDKVIESGETMLKIGRHFQEDNQTLVTETLGLSTETMMHISLKKLFEKHGMMEEKEELEKASKRLERRKDEINLIQSLGDAYVRVIVNKDLSDFPPEAQADPEKTIRELKEEMIDIIDENNLIKDKNLETRIIISYLLSRIGGERAIAILKEGLDDKDPYVHFFVRKLLEEINPTE